ncbi:MAG TPA: ASKHA domain-containing protein [Methylomusa anaerophila]|uniref:Na(+)-translocating NADH-quinone reductase subunit F n=1 Tax=Methylomusa anaerophila TaxID=1930071 RepID=A0A348AJ57_9FIRM|nr:ASKHA domain-containing protein [Methylomusa anaerophila]BBB91105.1 Na(+)-translocating NADH-quinone reductase subunit F [Methylomusa anaerophila]HML88982.1 ASKHA domain-containing protein [Methylomusa anaerophila]
MNQLRQYNLTVEGKNQQLKCSATQTLLQSLIDGGIFPEANCGGRGTCGKCKIHVLEGQVANHQGQQVFPGDDGSYLACQVYPRENITIRLKKSGASLKGPINENFAGPGTLLVRKLVLTPEYPTVENHYSIQEMIWQAVKVQEPSLCISDNSLILNDPKILRQLSGIVETKPAIMTICLIGNQLVNVEIGDTAGELFGVAFDIGTTTVVGMLVDINAREVIATCSKTNPQSSFGADVISRIQASNEISGGLVKLAAIIRQCLNQIITELCAQAGILPAAIYAATIAGNSTMTSLLLEISPVTLVRKPYAALFKHLAPFLPAEIDLNINPCGRVRVLPAIASFVGSDTTAAILAVDQDVSTSPLLLVDLGTNGEMVIGDSHKLCACSTAAGPAFEGAHIRDGMRASAGAIANVAIDEDVRVEVIGNVRPSGICGSGIVKAVAELVAAGIIGPSGQFDKSMTEVLPLSIGRRLKNRDGKWEFVLVEGKDSATGADISVTQADIRQIQLVKSSICTGIQFLLEQIPVDTELKVCLAGAFGNYIDINSAITIGLFPGITRDSICSVGNAAGTGAIQALLYSDKLQRSIGIANKTGYLELAAQPSFQNIFLANLSFPEVV